MENKKRDVSLPKRFNSEYVKKWQEQANLTNWLEERVLKEAEYLRDQLIAYNQ